MFNSKAILPLMLLFFSTQAVLAKSFTTSKTSKVLIEKIATNDHRQILLNFYDKDSGQRLNTIDHRLMCPPEEIMEGGYAYPDLLKPYNIIGSHSIGAPLELPDSRLLFVTSPGQRECDVQYRLSRSGYFLLVTDSVGNNLESMIRFVGEGGGGAEQEPPKVTLSDFNFSCRKKYEYRYRDEIQETISEFKIQKGDIIVGFTGQYSHLTDTLVVLDPITLKEKYQMTTPELDAICKGQADPVGPN